MPLQPPIKLDLAARTPACGPWARRVPKSITSRSFAAYTTLDALVAIDVWKLMAERRCVSTICDSIMGAVTPKYGFFCKDDCSFRHGVDCAAEGKFFSIQKFVAYVVKDR